MEREREYEGRLTAFYRTLEGAIGRLPAEVRASLYRPCAAECVRGDVLQDLLPGRDIRVECLGAVLSGSPECRFRVEVG